MSTVHKKMIIFLITDMEGLKNLDGNMLRGVTTDHDLMIINIEDAMLTGDIVYDADVSLYEKLFFSHNKKLHKKEVAQKKEMLDNAGAMCKQCKIGLATVSAQSEIIDKTIDLIERYKHGYYGYFTSSV